MHATPLDYYQACKRAGEVRDDPAQETVVHALHDFAQTIPRLTRHSFLPWKKHGGKRGFYIYGAVGRGKTMIMDMFYESVAGIPKRRVHFHAFMAEVHERLHVLRQKQGKQEKGDALLPQLARQIAKEARLLCFDEFQVHNIADAMILGRLFRFLFRAGVLVVATSNAAPEHLYKDGLQRALFLPFIDLIRKRLDVMDIGDGRDYRQERLKGLPVYLVPHDNQAYMAMQKIFERLTDSASPSSAEVNLSGRKFAVPKAARAVAWFSFDELCRQPLAASDYLKLMEHFHTIILENVPAFSDERRDEVLRFIHLVDVMYECGAKLVISAALPADQLLPAASSLWAQYARTASRLAEMQSQDYLQAPYAGLKAANP
jgi:cell division protein ZapE